MSEILAVAGDYRVRLERDWDWPHDEMYCYVFDLFMPPTWKPFAIGSGLLGYDYAKDVALAQFRHLTHDSHDENTQP